MARNERKIDIGVLRYEGTVYSNHLPASCFHHGQRFGNHAGVWAEPAIYAGGSSVRYSTANGLPSDRVLCLLHDGNRVWVGTDRGLALIENRKIARVFTVNDGLANAVVTALTIDSQTGDLWIATFGGLSRLSGGSFRNYTSLASGLANDVVYSVAVVHGEVWAATASGVSQLDLRSGSWTRARIPQSEPVDASSDAILMVGDSAFVGTWGAGAFEYRFAEGRWNRIHTERIGAQQGNLALDRGGSRFVTSAASI